MIAIIDYGMGNLRSVQKAFSLFYKDVKITSKPKDIYLAKKIVFPGVGSFGPAMYELKKRRLIEPIKENIKKGKPFLGLCLGLQLLFTKSYEGGVHKGLDIIKGEVKRFPPRKGLKIPHMGWNQVVQSKKFKVPAKKRGGKSCPLFKEVPDGSYMYFVHSYYVVPEEKNTIIAKTGYGISFVSAVRKDNIYGLQFHPEKSQKIGLKIIKNFVKI